MHLVFVLVKNKRNIFIQTFFFFLIKFLFMERQNPNLENI